MNSRSNSFDWWLITPPVLLSILGLVVLRSIAPDQLLPQIISFAIGIFVFLFFSFTDYKIFFALYLPIYLISIIFLLTPFIFGVHSRGALRWLQFGTMTIQPSELIKPFLIIAFTMAAIKLKKRYLIGLFLLPAAIIFAQPDLGTTLVISVSWLTVFLTKISIRWIIVIGLISILLVPSGWLILKSYQKDRIHSFLNPYSDPLGRGYHVIQSTIAVGSGQLFGRGLGHGTQSQLKFLPEHYTDFIFASLTEELGFVGGFLVIIFYSIILIRIYYLSKYTSNPAAAMFCLSNLALLTFQIFVNMGMNMSIAPITGITLPFLSYGGSSLLSLAINFGLLSSISREVKTSSSLQIS